MWLAVTLQILAIVVHGQYLTKNQVCIYPNKCFMLYRAEGDHAPWEEASKYCQSIGYKLATIPDDVTQAIISRFTSSDTGSRYVWFGGKRSSELFWRDVSADPWFPFVSYISDDDWCSMLTIQHHVLEDIGLEASPCHDVFTPKRAICELPEEFKETCGRYSPSGIQYNVSKVCHEVTHVTFASWNDARQHCVQEYRGLLASRYITSGNILRGNYKVGDQFWTGVSRRPWCWVQANDKEIPMTFTRWQASEGSNTNQLCLAIDIQSNSSWVSMSCSEKLQLFMCEGDPTRPKPDTPTDKGTHPTVLPSPVVPVHRRLSVQSLLFNAGLRVILLLFIVIVTLRVYRGRKTKNRCPGENKTV